MPRHLDFENRAERRKLMEQFRKEAEGRNIAGYGDYASKMDELDRLMDEYSELDEMGLPASMTEEMKQKLIQMITETAKTGEAYLDNVKQEAEKDPKVKLTSGAPALVTMLQGMLARDMQELAAYDTSKEQLSFPEILERGRTRTVDVGNKKLKAMGGALSSRMTMQMVSKNSERKGLFTAAKRVDLIEQYNKVIDKAKNASNDPKTKESLDSLLPKYKEYKIKRNPSLKNKDDGFFIIDMIRTSCGETDMGHCGNPFRIIHFERILKVCDINLSQLKASSLKEIEKGFKALNGDANYVLNGHFLDLHEGERVDVSNAAMSTVASFFHCPNLIAKSFNMNLRQADGTVVPGTFMDYAEGLDLNKVRNFAGVNDDPLKANAGKLIADLADLQIIDYICGNVDRHVGNLMFQTDAEGNITGFTGIDNDASFGHISGILGNVKMLAGLDNLNCISEQMAVNIKNTDPAMLKFVLRGRGLSEGQIEHSVKRLEDLKFAIERGEKHYEGRQSADKENDPFDKGYLRILSKDELYKMTFDKMNIKRKGWAADQKNLFSEVHDHLDKNIKYSRYNGVRYDPSYEAPPFEPTKLLTSENRYTVSNIEGFILDSASIMAFKQKSIDELTKKKALSSEVNGSTEFSDMVEAVKNIARAKQELQKRAEKGDLLTPLDYLRHLESVNVLVKDLDGKAQIYLNKKMGEKKVTTLSALHGKNAYERDRIDYAKNVSAWAKESLRSIKEEAGETFEMDEVKQADYRSMREQQDLDDARAANEALKKLHEELGLADPAKLKKAMHSEDPKDKEIVDQFKEKISAPKSVGPA